MNARPVYTSRLGYFHAGFPVFNLNFIDVGDSDCFGGPPPGESRKNTQLGGANRKKT